MNSLAIATERFSILRCVGEGATGRVFEVEDKVHGGRFALKRLHDHKYVLEHIVRFKDEFRTLERISHPNLAKVYELISDATGIYLLMELVAGIDFVRYVRSVDTFEGPSEHDGRSGDTGSGDGPRSSLPWGGTLSLERLHAALPQVVAGVRALHAAGKIHSDIKPENVLVTADGRVRILDFGLLTEGVIDAGAGRGTPAFMAPEQFGGLFTEAVDWYAIGALLYCALIGRPPPVAWSYSRGAKDLGIPLDPRVQATGLPDELADLAVRLLERNPNARPTGDEVARIVGLRSLPAVRAIAFVGRESELVRLEKAFEAVRGGQSRTVHVHGDSGMGKTALVSHFARSAEARGALVFRGACYIDADVPYKALDCVIDRIATTVARLGLPLDPRDREGLATMFTVFGPADGVPERDPASLRAKALQAFRALLVRLTERAPVVICIDDIQWSDVESVDLLADALRLPSPPNVLLVLSYRSVADGVGHSVNYARGELGCDEDVALGPLSAAALRSIVEAASGKLPAETLDAVVRESGGNPFFAEELLRAHAGGYAGDALSVDGVVAARVQRLHANHRTYLELVAVAGRPLDERIVRRALGATQGAVRAARRVLVAESLVRIAEDETRTVEPYHARIGEHVLSSLPAEVSRSRHEALAVAYEASPDPDPETLAVHYRAAGNRTKALRYSEIAGDASARALAFDHAAAVYRASFGLAEGPARDELRMKYAMALSNARRPGEAARAFIGALGHRPGDFELLLHAGDEFLRAGKMERGLALLRAAAARTGEWLPKNTMVAKLVFLWREFRLRRVGAPVIREVKVPASDWQRLSVNLTICRALVTCDFILAALVLTRYLLLALKTRSRVHTIQGLALKACICAQLPPRVAGGIPRAERLLEQVNALVRETDSPFTRGCTWLVPGAIAFARGQWGECRVALDALGDLLPEETPRGFQWDVLFCRTIIVETLWMEGDVRAMRTRLDTFLRESKGHVPAESLLTLRGGVLLALWEDRAAEARPLADDAAARWPREPYRIPHYFCDVARNEIDLYEGRAEAAWRRQRISGAAMKGAWFHQISIYFLTDTIFRARAALALGRHSKAAGAIRSLQGRTEQWAAAIGGALHGCLLAARGQTREAAVALRNAVQSLDAWNLCLYAAAARYRLARVEDDLRGQMAAVREFERRGVRAPARLIASLLPMAASC
jgi:hypothetical protein